MNSHRFFRSLVLGVAALALMLPAAAQAQNLGDEGVRFDDTDGFKLTWTDAARLDTDDLNNWIVTVTKPNGTKVVVTTRSTSSSTLGAVSTDDIAGLDDLADKTLDYNQRDLGTWWFQVDACFADIPAAPAAAACPTGELEAGTAVGYTHGAPEAPENFNTSYVPSGVTLTWDELAKDHGISGYQYAYKTKADGKPDWKAAMGGAQVIGMVAAGEHTFMLRAQGRSDNNTATMAPIDGMAAESMVTVPMASPTLSEWGVIFLGLMLMGGGVYYIRRHQTVPQLTA